MLAEPGEFRFHIHPSVRPALRSESATDLRPYRPSDVIRSHASRQDAAQLNLGGIARQFIVRGDIEYSTLDAIHSAGDRINGMLDDPGLPRGVIEEVRGQITSMLADAELLRERITQQRITGGFGGQTHEIDQFGRWTVAFLSGLGAQLSSGPVGSELRVQELCRRLESEARRLSDAAGLSREAQRRRDD